MGIMFNDIISEECSISSSLKELRIIKINLAYCPMKKSLTSLQTITSLRRATVRLLKTKKLLLVSLYHQLLANNKMTLIPTVASTY